MSTSGCDFEILDLQDRLPDGLYAGCTRYEPAIEHVFETWLSEAETRRMLDFGSKKRRREFVLGRGTARRLLAQHMEISPPDVEIDVGANGEPGVPNTDWRLSIAHSEFIAAAVISKSAVGVDVEPIVTRRTDLYRYLLHPDEYALLEESGRSHNETQILLWSLKESVLKAKGLGFLLSPKRLRVALLDDEQSAVIRMESEIWHVLYDVVAGHFVSVAYQRYKT